MRGTSTTRLVSGSGLYSATVRQRGSVATAALVLLPSQVAGFAIRASDADRGVVAASGLSGTVANRVPNSIGLSKGEA